MIKILRYSAIVLALVALVFFVTDLLQVASEPGPSVMVKHNLELKETVYSIVDEFGKISLDIAHTELNRGIIHLRSNSSRPMTEQLALIAKIFKRLMQDYQPADFHTLFVGRLEYAFGRDHTLSQRISQAAAQSDLWNSLTGRPVSGQTNEIVKQIANQALIYPELKQLFNAFGYAIKISSMEKVLIEQQGDKILPFDAQTWFRLSVK